MNSTPSPVTALLSNFRAGDSNAVEKLFPLLYDELRRLAGRYLGHERPDHTLQATALVHEAYLRLVGDADTHLENRAHFFALAAQVMRRLLVDHARARKMAKRGGGAPKLSLDEALQVGGGEPEELLGLDGALTRLTELDPRKARIIEMRFFGGLSVEEAASVLELSTATIVNETRAARAWLYSDLSERA